MQEKRLPEKTPSLVASAILKTLAYAEVFQFPLEADEVFFYLISPVPFSSVEVGRALSSLVREGIVDHQENLYFLKGRENLVPLRRRRENASKTKWQKALSWARFFRLCPWIKLVGVSGALAMGNSEADDDIDLFLITSVRRLWLSRALVAIFLLLAGQYRRPGRVSDRFCPNFWLAEDTLMVAERNLFTAHEIAQLKPLWEKGGVWRRFSAANHWVTNFLPHVFPAPAVLETRPPNPVNSSVGRLLDVLEKIAMLLQLQFMAGKKTREVTTASVLRFHPRDTARLVLAAYEGKSGEALVQYSRVSHQEKPPSRGQHEGGYAIS